MYYRYLKKLYEQSSAAWRRHMRKNPKPCAICGDENSEVMPEEIWLCREHKAQWKNAQPYKSHAKLLDEMGIAYLSEEDFTKGKEKPKKKRKIPKLEVKEIKEWSYTAGKSTPAKRTTKKK
jgi:ribosomal protein L37AE/L43A